jgi:hypothetical protein
MSHAHHEAALRAHASQQHGVVGRNQVDALGVNLRWLRTQVEHGRWTRPTERTWVLAGSDASWMQRAWIGVLSIDDPLTAVAGDGAARLHRIDGFARARPVVGSKGRVHVVLLPDVTFRFLPSLLAEHTTVVDGIPTTTAARTILDLAATTSEHRLTRAIDGGVRDRRFTEDELCLALAAWRRSGRTGTRKLASVLGVKLPGGGRPESWLERRLLEICAEAGLPTPIVQKPVFDASGRLRRLDAVFPGTPVVVEVEGELGHADRLSRQRDFERRTNLGFKGWVVLPFTWNDAVFRPRYVVSQIRRALAAAA